MSKESFDQLLGHTRQDIIVNEVMAEPRGGIVIPGLCLFCTLRHLAGGSYLDICDITGVSKSSFYQVVWKTIEAIVKCKHLELKFPKTREECKSVAKGFRSISTGKAIIDCVGVVNGYLLHIRVPPKNVAGNQSAYFSGHYQCHGMNIQAVSDHRSCFLHFATAAPGVTPDRDAIAMCSLHGMIESLPLGFCIIGDPACQVTERMITIFSHNNRLLPANDNFNYYSVPVSVAFVLKWPLE